MCEKSVKKSGEAVGFCVLFVCFFFATDQAKQNMRETPSEQKIQMFLFFFLKANAWQRRRLKSWAKMVFGTLRSASTLVKHKRNKYVKRLDAKWIEALSPLASQGHSRFSLRDIGTLFPIWPTGHRHTIPDLAYGTSAASRVGVRWGSCERGYPYLPSVTVYIRSYPRHSIAH